MFKVKTGSKHVGTSATTETKELYASETELRNDVSAKLANKRQYRRSRRNRKKCKHHYGHWKARYNFARPIAFGALAAGVFSGTFVTTSLAMDQVPSSEASSETETQPETTASYPIQEPLQNATQSFTEPAETQAVPDQEETAEAGPDTEDESLDNEPEAPDSAQNASDSAPESSDSKEKTETKEKTDADMAEQETEAAEEDTEEQDKTKKKSKKKSEKAKKETESDDQASVSLQDATQSETSSLSEASEPSADDYTYKKTDKTLYVTLDLNVRSGPSTDFEIIGWYPKGKEVKVEAKCEETGWYRISYDGNTAYISGKYVSSEKPAEETKSSSSSSSGSSSNSSNSSSSSSWTGSKLTKQKGVNQGPSGKETYYNLNMSGVVKIMRSMGNTDEYWIRSDGCKMLGDYIMVAANLSVHPRGSLVETSLGTGIVCDTGGFAKNNPNQLDIAVNW